MTAAVRASIHDRRFAGAHPAFVLGPVQIPGGADGVRRRVHEFARSGRRDRVGLVPRRDSARWDLDPDRIVVRSRSDDGPLDVAAELVHAVDPGAPMNIDVVGGDHLVGSYDHGLGDGVFILELLAALTHPVPRFPLDVASAPSAIAGSPTRTALTHQVRAHPTQVARASARVLRRAGPSADAIVPVTPIPAAPACVVHVPSSPDFVDQLTRHRDTRYPGASPIAVFAHLLSRQLVDSGAAVSDSVSFMVNLRRYLPSHSSTLGNFIGAIDVDVHSPTDATRQLRAAVKAPDLLIRQALSDGVARVFPGRLGAAHTFRRAATDAISLIVSDLTAHPAAETLGWSTDGPRTFAIAGVTRVSNHASLILTRVGRQMHVTASLLGGFVDPEVVRSALTRVLTTPLDTP